MPAGRLEVLVVDAFSSDAVPMHLLTEEAMDVYGRALRPDGLLAMHISNRYLDLEPVVAANARARGWTALLLRHSPDPREIARQAATPSVWVILSRDERKLDQLVASGTSPAMWWALNPRPGISGWTDDYASILPLIELPDLW